MAKKQFISFVLDETGSMSYVERETISGFNEYIDTLKDGKKSKNIRFTLTKFNSDKVDVVYDGVKIADVAHLDKDSYHPAAMTPLLDAIGSTIRSLEEQMKGEKKSKGLVVIQTDGQENASQEYNPQSLFALIDTKKEEGWTFVFLGADQDAWLTSQALGISLGNTVSYDSANTRGTFSAAASASAHYSNTGGDQTENLFSDADVDVDEL